MNAGFLIRRLLCVSVVVAVVSLPRILAAPFSLPSSGVAGDPVSEAAERHGPASASPERVIAAPLAASSGEIVIRSPATGA